MYCGTLSAHNTCRHITGTHVNKRVLIPRNRLAPSDANLSFTLQRHQFPIRLAYATTINRLKDKHSRPLGSTFQSQCSHMDKIYTLRFPERNPLAVSQCKLINPIVRDNPTLRTLFTRKSSKPRAFSNTLTTHREFRCFFTTPLGENFQEI